ncbi:serine/threonine protein phosphatase [candidate division KSB3 bacterium]|uniref:Serine/threonine protein phosphatase n=1 Tax=candidate division KSB3 bacterium TaxID=2044937 RepID=A0A2G6E0B9_9BACT|nr:MAG: serine/threonine protein phosphatase [candidate division KSB3 bacterium]
MTDPLKKILAPIQELQTIRGVKLPIGLEFLQLVVTGPPGAGKSYYIEQIKGWPNEGYVDLAQKGWWKNQSLVYRPREVHLGFPFKDHKESLTVFDKEYLKQHPAPSIDFSRIILPPVKTNMLQTNWRKRYIFEFLIPPPSIIYKQRLTRKETGYFPVDENLNMDMVRQQVAVYREIALYLHRAGLNVYVRKGLANPPLFFSEPGVANVPRWTLNKIPRKPGLHTVVGWKYLFKKYNPVEWITVSNTPQIIKRPGRIAHDGKSFSLLMGTSWLRFHPEIALGIKKKNVQKNWIIDTNHSCSFKQIRGFIRLKVGETIVLGRSNPEFLEFFDFDDTVRDRHISVTNRKGDIILSPITSEYETKVVLLNDLDLREQLAQNRHKAFLKIRQIFSDRLTPFDPKIALDSIKAVNNLLTKEPFRPLNSSGVAGGLIEIPARTSPVIVGDLHGQVDNLLKILSENCLLDCLRLKTATLIILGDAIHSENVHDMDQFEPSVLIMDLIFRLKLTFPENVFYIRGNHDSFSPELNKNGYLQGELFKEALLEMRGEEYVREMEKFYTALAYVIRSEQFICCHAGPPRVETTRDDIINIEPDSKLARELTRVRIQRPNYLGGYVNGDVPRLIPLAVTGSMQGQ